MTEQELDQYWDEFLRKTGRSPEDKCAGDLKFEAKGFVADELVSLVLGKKKTAFFSSYATFQIDNEPLPVSGELYTVLNRNNDAVCVIEITDVSVIPFNDVTWGMAQKEGEDENLEEWRARKREYLEDEGAVLGFEFTPDIKLVFQVFRVVYF